MTTCYTPGPELRAHVDEHTLAAFVATGHRVHRIGAAAYVHGWGGHFLFGVWDPHEPRPSWAGRLGVPSPGYFRREHRLGLEHRGRAYLRDRHGRFLVHLPWYRVPPVQVHSFEAPGLSLAASEERRAAERRAELREHGWWA